MSPLYPPGSVASFSSTQRLDTRRGDELKPRSSVNGSQKAVNIGDTIPIVFCRRVGSTGGVWLSPPASEAQFSNDAITNSTGVHFHLVLCDGPIGTLLGNDVYHGDTPISVGFTQAYSARAGSFAAGNYINQYYDSQDYTSTSEVTGAVGQLAEATFSAQGSYPTWFSVTWEKLSGDSGNMQGYSFSGFTSTETSQVTQQFTEYGVTTKTIPSVYRATIRGTDRPPKPKPEAPLFCGTGGTYYGISTLDFAGSYSSGSSKWNRQVHVFIRSGRTVTRVLDGVTGSSNNFCDLTILALRSGDRVPTDLIDYTLMQSTAAYLDAQGLLFNGVLGTSTNVRDFINRTAPFFISEITQRNGKWALIPSLPLNNSNQYYTGTITPAYVFTSDDFVVGSYRRTYKTLADRKPFCAIMLWREQPSDDVGLIRTTEVRYTGAALDGPFEQYDMSDFCVTEAHAIKAGKYQLARRKYIEDEVTAEILVSPGISSLTKGSIVKHELTRITSDGTTSTISRFYQITEIGREENGSVSMAFEHFPTDANDASLIALDLGGSSSGGQTGAATIGTVTIDVSVRSVPSAPASLSATPTNASVILTWAVPTTSGYSPISDYVVQYKLTSASEWSTFSDGTSTSTSANVTGLTNEVAYNFRVAAVSAQGQGAWSTTATATPTSVVPTFTSLWIEPVWLDSLWLFPEDA